MKTQLSYFKAIGSIMLIASLTTGCDPKYSSSAGVARPKTNANASDGLNPLLQSATRTNASTTTVASADEVVGTNSTTGQYILNFVVADNGRNVNFQTVQAADELGFDTQTYNSRYSYMLDTECIDQSCLEVVVMVSETDKTTNKNFQSVYVINDTGGGYQVVKTVPGTSYDYIDDAVAGVIAGPPAP